MTTFVFVLFVQNFLVRVRVRVRVRAQKKIFKMFVFVQKIFVRPSLLVIVFFFISI
jgi:hypothetical protein